MQIVNLRNLVVAAAVVAGALLANHLQAAPPVSCQATTPHHKLTLGPKINWVSVTSSHQYWDNDCKNFIAQVEVPSTSSPKDPAKFKSRVFFSDGQPPLGPSDQAACGSYKRKFFVYKEEAGTLKLEYGGTTSGSWLGKGPDILFPCNLVSDFQSKTFAPPATGTDTYRVLASFEDDNKFRPVTITASHVPVPPPPPK